MNSIILSTPFVRAVLAGRKTMHSVPIVPQPPAGWFLQDCPTITEEIGHQWTEHDWDDDMMGWFPDYEHGIKPPYRAGQIVPVREAWVKYGRKYFYRADANIEGSRAYDNEHFNIYLGWKSPATMPRAAARIWLKVLDCRPQRVREITEDELRAEGVPDGLYALPPSTRYGLMQNYYRGEWDARHARRGYPWETAWAWVTRFERAEGPDTADRLMQARLEDKR